ncbi:MAG: hypothetical protein U9O97_07790 [Elusimicrobiota bacterium]|nr:hypothetical protein [Elusimicrobiota bacterium]
MALFSREGKVSPDSAGFSAFHSGGFSAAAMALAMLAAGGVMSVFYFPASVPLGILKASGRKRGFFLFLAFAAAFAAATAPPAGFPVFAAAAAGCAVAGLLESPADYFRKLFTGFFAALFVLLAAGRLMSLVSVPDIFRALSKIFLFSLAGKAEIMSGAHVGILAEKAFRILPAMALIMLTAGYFLNIMVMGFFTGKRTAFDKAAGGVPASVYVLALALTGGIAQKYFLAGYLSENILTASVFLFFVSGCGILWSLFRRAGAGKFMSSVLTAAFAFIWPAAAAVGVAGKWIKFKRSKKKIDCSPTNRGE